MSHPFKVGQIWGWEGRVSSPNKTSWKVTHINSESIEYIDTISSKFYSSTVLDWISYLQEEKLSKGELIWKLIEEAEEQTVTPLKRFDNIEI